MPDRRPVLKDSVYRRLVHRVHDVADVLIEQAQSGEHPEDAILLFKYFIAQTDRGVPVDPRVNSYIAAGLSDAIRRLPAGGNAAAIDAFILLGLIRPKAGRPAGSGGKFSKESLAEMKHDIAHKLAVGLKHVKIKEQIASSFDCSEEAVGSALREIVRRAAEAVTRADENASKTTTADEQAPAGAWLDDIDCYALELGVTRQIVEAIGRRRLARNELER